MKASQASHRSSKQQKRTLQRRKAQHKSLSLLVSGVVFLAIVVYVSLAVRQPDPNAAVRPAEVGRPISDLVLTDLQGNQVKLSDFAGQPVLINAWATWCPPCRAEMPALNDFYEAHQSEGFTLLAINAGESRGTAANFIDEMEFSFPVLFDPDLEVLTRLGVRSYPTSILVGRDGLVKGVHVGLFTPEAIQAELTPLLEAQ